MPSEFDSVAFSQKLAEYGVPDQNWPGLWGYYNIGQPLGSFLDAVVRNDLKQACARADDNNKYAIHNIVAFMWNVFPADIWGSPEAVEAWLEKHSKLRNEQKAANV